MSFNPLVKADSGAIKLTGDIDLNGHTIIGSTGGGGAGGRSIVAIVPVAGDFNGVPLTPLYTAPAAGYYAVSTYAVVTGLATTSDSVQASLDWNDGVGVFASVGLGILREYYLLGAKASIVEQDLTYTAQVLGEDGNNIVIQYLDDGTAGSETVDVSGTTITVHEQSGVSTADQIKTAVDNKPEAVALVSVDVTGTGSNPQTVLPVDNLLSGRNSATVTAGGVTVTYGVEWATYPGSNNGAAANLVTALTTAGMIDVVVVANGEGVMFHSTTPGTPGNAFTISYFDPGVAYQGGTTAFDQDGAPATKSRNFTGGSDTIIRTLHDNNTNSGVLPLNTDQTGRFQNETIIKTVINGVISYKLDYFPATPPGDGTYTYYFVVEQLASVSNGISVTEVTPSMNLTDPGFYWFSPSFQAGRVTLPDASTVSGKTFAFNGIQSLDLNANAYSIAAGPDGNIWIGDLANTSIWKLTSAGEFTRYQIPSGGFPYGICAGPDGNMWFTCQAPGNSIGKCTMSGVITEYPIPTASANPQGICSGSDGNLWFTEAGPTNNIGQCTTAGVITEFPIPTPSSFPVGICDGSTFATGTITITDITTLNTVNGNISVWYPYPTNDIFIYAGIGGATYWGATANDAATNIANALNASSVVRATASGNVVTVISKLVGSAGNSITIGGNVFAGQPALGIEFSNGYFGTLSGGVDGDLWFAEESANNIAKCTTAGVITEYPVTTPSSGPRHICMGPNGNLWFTDQADLIGTMDLSGNMIAEYPTLSSPQGICAGPDGNLWVFLPDTAQIGKLTTAGVLTTYQTKSGGGIGICSGPEGKLWVGNGQSLIYNINTSGSQQNYYPLHAVVATINNQMIDGIDSTSYPIGVSSTVIRVVSNGSNWFTT
jgi:streptogramin lyase